MALTHSTYSHPQSILPLSILVGDSCRWCNENFKANYCNSMVYTYC